MAGPDRRAFLASSAVASLTALTAAGAAEKPNDRIILAVMGVRGRGRGIISGFSSMEDVEIRYLCEVDDNVVPGALKSIHARHKTTPRIEKDIRRVLDDKEVTAIAIAAPDHWHALATVWGCQATKDVYVEKPVSHNILEGRRMVEAARKYNRVVQAGTQRRSGEDFHAAAEFIRSGKLGRVAFARTWINGGRPTIGHKPDGPVPAGVDYNLWLGPAPERPFNPNRFHYEWHWFWDYGTGELGNNGVHSLDVVRMVLGLDAPARVTSGGGINFYDDDRETPDTQVAVFDFPGTTVTWEQRIWSKDRTDDEGITLFGENGTLVFDRKGWHVRGGVEAAHKRAPFELPHLRNFLECVRSRKRPNADIEELHKSTRLCHLGNIAYRLGRTVRFNSSTETILGDPDANRLLGRTYRKGFAVPDTV
jgi:predicted dehydrogenase